MSMCLRDTREVHPSLVVSAAESGIKIAGDGSCGPVGEQVIHDIAQDAGPAASAAVKFVFGSAADPADDVESDDGATV